jgi:hypothetical protein
MSLVEFDTLRAKHAGDIAAIGRLETAIVKAVARDADAKLDEYLLSVRTSVPISLIEVLLVELCKEGVLEPRAFWNCPNGLGVIDEREAIADFPLFAECPCGHQHLRDDSDLEIGFVPTSRLVDHLRQAQK